MIRASRPDEAPALLAAYEWLFAPPGSRPALWDRARAEATLRELAAADDAAVLVAEDEDRGGAIAGLCTVYLDIRSVRFGQRAWIEDLAVDADRRSAGLGKALLDAAKDWAREHGATHLELDSGFARTDAHRFYEREEPSWDSRSFGWLL